MQPAQPANRVHQSSLPRWLCSAFLLLAGLAVASFFIPQAARAASNITWQRYEVDVVVRDDGSIHVTERQAIEFTGQSYSAGFATIPMDRIDDITNVQVSEDRDGHTIAYKYVDWQRYSDNSETFAYSRSGDDFEIAWGFPTTVNDTRTFVIEYDVLGAMRVYTEGSQTWEQIWWTAISKDVTDVGDVLKSDVMIELPKPVDPQLAKLGENAEENAADHTTDGRVWTWSKYDLQSDDEFIVRLEVPVVTEAVAPAWQAEDDQQRLEEQKRDDRQSLYDLFFLGIGLLSTVLAGAGLYGLWYTRGRDPHVGLTAQFLPEPPDDLPPGAVGALLDEVANERDVVATVVNLGSRGVIKIDEHVAGDERPDWPSQDFQMTLLQSNPQVTPFERTLLSTLFGPELKDGTRKRMSQVKGTFDQNSELVKDQIYAELVNRGYFTASPEQTRDRWRSGSLAALVVFVLLMCVGGAILARVSSFVFFPLAVVLLFIVALVFLSRVLPKKTPAGAEAAAKWQAFRRYLGDIEKYDRVNESQTIFDKYLPYAVAFGLEQSWVNKFAAVGAEMPPWYGPVILGDFGELSRPSRQRRGGWGGGTWVFPSDGGGGVRPSGGGGFGGFGLPDLQDMSDRGGGSIQGASNSLFDMLSSAAEAFGDFSSSGGGGRRHWGGGGGGFSGGGFRGGSSGGGRRGFR